MAKVYLETSFVSACVTTRSDTKSAYRREVSLEWWSTQREQHELYVSDEVIAELSDSRYPQREEALNYIEGIESLEVSEVVVGLAKVLVKEKVMPGPLKGDALHVAVATIYAMEFIVSWNVRHLANRNKLEHLNNICLRVGLIPPRIITPDLLWEGNYESN